MDDRSSKLVEADPEKHWLKLRSTLADGVTVDHELEAGGDEVTFRRNDVNPRPLSTIVPSNGLIGCYSADGSMIMASAWEPYQELFQGVLVCLHSDFRIGGLKPGETKTIRGKIYLVKNDVPALVKRFEGDFPTQRFRGR